MAKKLATLFVKNFAGYEAGASTEVKAARPVAFIISVARSFASTAASFLRKVEAPNMSGDRVRSTRTPSGYPNCYHYLPEV
jgi:hypothetical protein